MNHPTPETWVEYLYGELPAVADRDCRNHLNECHECRARVEAWQATQQVLDQDRATLTPHTEPMRARWSWRPSGAIPWAAAAAVTLGIGFLAGRLSGPSRRDLEADLARTRQELRQEFQSSQEVALRATAVAAASATASETRRYLQEFSAQFQAARTGDRRELLQTLQSLEAQHDVDLAVLRRDLSQLARTTGSGFRQAESQFNVLASQLPAESASGPLPVGGSVPVR